MNSVSRNPDYLRFCELRAAANRLDYEINTAAGIVHFKAEHDRRIPLFRLFAGATVILAGLFSHMELSLRLVTVLIGVAVIVQALGPWVQHYRLLFEHTVSLPALQMMIVEMRLLSHKMWGATTFEIPDWNKIHEFDEMLAAQVARSPSAPWELRFRWSEVAHLLADREAVPAELRDHLWLKVRLFERGKASLPSHYLLESSLYYEHDEKSEILTWSLTGSWHYSLVKTVAALRGMHGEPARRAA